MTFGYWFAIIVLAALFGIVAMASYLGWGLDSDASARARSVRNGSLHTRSFYGGGPGYGK